MSLRKKNYGYQSGSVCGVEIWGAGFTLNRVIREEFSDKTTLELRRPDG